MITVVVEVVKKCGIQWSLCLANNAFSHLDIVHGNGKVITSVKKISNDINEFFVKKIENIRKNIKSHNFQAIDFLKKFIPKPNKSFSLKAPSVARIKGIISKLKSSNASGFDNISIKI